MPTYRFEYSYTARGSRELDFDSDTEAKEYGWDDPEDLIDPFYDYDADIDADDVEIVRLDDDGNADEWLTE